MKLTLYTSAIALLFFVYAPLGQAKEDCTSLVANLTPIKKEDAIKNIKNYLIEPGYLLSEGDGEEEKALQGLGNVLLELIEKNEKAERSSTNEDYTITKLRWGSEVKGEDAAVAVMSHRTSGGYASLALLRQLRVIELLLKRGERDAAFKHLTWIVETFSELSIEDSPLLTLLKPLGRFFLPTDYPRILALSTASVRAAIETEWRELSGAYTRRSSLSPEGETAVAQFRELHRLSPVTPAEVFKLFEGLRAARDFRFSEPSEIPPQLEELRYLHGIYLKSKRGFAFIGQTLADFAETSGVNSSESKAGFLSLASQCFEAARLYANEDIVTQIEKFNGNFPKLAIKRFYDAPLQYARAIKTEGARNRVYWHNGFGEMALSTISAMLHTTVCFEAGVHYLNTLPPTFNVLETYKESASLILPHTPRDTIEAFLAGWQNALNAHNETYAETRYSDLEPNRPMGRPTRRGLRPPPEVGETFANVTAHLAMAEMLSRESEPELRARGEALILNLPTSVGDFLNPHVQWRIEPTIGSQRSSGMGIFSSDFNSQEFKFYALSRGAILFPESGSLLLAKAREAFLTLQPVKVNSNKETAAFNFLQKVKYRSAYLEALLQIGTTTEFDESSALLLKQLRQVATRMENQLQDKESFFRKRTALDAVNLWVSEITIAVEARKVISDLDAGDKSTMGPRLEKLKSLFARLPLDKMARQESALILYTASLLTKHLETRELGADVFQHVAAFKDEGPYVNDGMGQSFDFYTFFQALQRSRLSIMEKQSLIAKLIRSQTKAHFVNGQPDPSVWKNYTRGGYFRFFSSSYKLLKGLPEFRAARLLILDEVTQISRDILKPGVVTSSYDSEEWARVLDEFLGESDK